MGSGVTSTEGNAPQFELLASRIVEPDAGGQVTTPASASMKPASKTPASPETPSETSAGAASRSPRSSTPASRTRQFERSTRQSVVHNSGPPSKTVMVEVDTGYSLHSDLRKLFPSHSSFSS